MIIGLINRKVIICITLIVGLTAGIIGVGQAIANNSDIQGKEIVPSFPTNETGQTYGSSLYCTSPETEPDLVKALGVDGTEGYALNKDLNGEEPKTPEEALAIQAKLPPEGRVIPLYAKDGKTVIGEFRIKNGEPPEDIEK